VYHNAAKFLRKGHLIGFGVIGYAFGADKEIAFKSVGKIGIIEGDDIGIIVVIEVFDIDLPEVFIGAEDVGNFVNGLAFGFGDIEQPGAYGVRLREIKGDIFKMKFDVFVGF
jgi:hypothetical protein